ncbi:hypothetical protein CIT292_06460 [Citrobacter youngae ATCC 29220]|uniref:Uncharacterized protein n=1 Tax=Citrobacter youngae ATCC 29220 TaxID=500640 RepID=D4B8B8_9ENTR|nr:hypothetical protein CIT292_06460 [Citrobacter youngae ATCC 29220]
MQCREGISLPVISGCRRYNSRNVTTGNNLLAPIIIRKYRRWGIYLAILSISIKS